MRTCCLRILLAAVDWEEELLPPPLSRLGGEGAVEEERRGQSSKFNGPWMDGTLGALEVDGRFAALVRERGIAMDAKGSGHSS